MAVKNEERETRINNLKATKATLESIVGDNTSALETISSVLKDDPENMLALFRRSQIHKKVSVTIIQMGKFKKAMKDLNKVSLYSPDNLQLAALKIEI